MCQLLIHRKAVLRSRVEGPRVERCARALLLALRRCSGVRESALRDRFGNSADVSKALRLLLTRRMVLRTGVGGQKDPFRYASA
jgi:hypothetical protein